MNVRLMFSELSLIKKEISERFLVVLRDLYKEHPVYNYTEDEADAKLLIYPSYGNPDRDGTQARMVIKVGSYNYHLMDTLNNNMSREIIKDGILVGLEHSQIITVPVTILVQAYAEEESSDLADELATLIVFACRNRFSEKGLIARGAQVSETDTFNQEQKIFQTSISCTFDIPWVTRMEDTGEPINQAELEFESEETLQIETYQSPGVSVMK